MTDQSTATSEPCAFTYKADLICPACIRETAVVKARNNGMSDASIRANNLAFLLDFWAYAEHIDRHDESAFDSDLFPKAVMLVNDCQHCGLCGHVIGATFCVCVERCPACGDPIDYCSGHGMMRDPSGYSTLKRHDSGDHSTCLIRCEP